MKLKKLLSVISAFGLLCIVSPCINAQDIVVNKSDTQVYIDNNIVELDNKPTEHENGKWLPVTELCKYLNYSIQIEAKTGIVQIAPGNACKNSDGVTEKVIFEIGSEKIETYSDGCVNVIENVYTDNDSVYSPLSYRLNDEIYMPAYYMCRMLNLKLKRYSDLEPNTVKIFTRNYLKSAVANANPKMIVTKDLSVIADGVTVPFRSKPIIDENGRTLVPIRELCELLNYSIMWFDAPGRVSVSTVPADTDKMYGRAEGGGAGGGSIWFTIGEKQYRINGEYYEMDTTAKIINNRTYVPLRILSEFLGYDVVYSPVSGS